MPLALRAGAAAGLLPVVAAVAAFDTAVALVLPGVGAAFAPLVGAVVAADDPHAASTAAPAKPAAVCKKLRRVRVPITVPPF